MADSIELRSSLCFPEAPSSLRRALIDLIVTKIANLTVLTYFLRTNITIRRSVGALTHMVEYGEIKPTAMNDLENHREKFSVPKVL